MYSNIRRKKVGAMGNLPLRKAGEGCLRIESATPNSIDTLFFK